MQTIFLERRGQATGHCPISNLFETMAFFSWCLVLTYLLVGQAYRMSILGAFTSPVAFFINFLALAVTDDMPRPLPKLGWQLELHATLALMGLGILGVAALAGVAYLIQDRQLKSHNLSAWFYTLPTVGRLELVQTRVLWLGFCIFTAGAMLGFSIPQQPERDWVKIAWSSAVCVLYAGVLAVLSLGYLSHKKAAWVSISSYILILVTWWVVNSESTDHMFGGQIVSTEVKR